MGLPYAVTTWIIMLATKKPPQSHGEGGGIVRPSKYRIICRVVLYLHRPPDRATTRKMRVVGR